MSPSDNRSKIGFLFATVALLLLAAWLGVQGLDREALWYDEIWSVRVAGGANFGPLTAQGILERVIFIDPTQGLGYPLLLGGWGAVFGWSEFAIRLLAYFGGLLAIALTYRLGSDVGGRSVGLCAALFMSVSAFFIWYLHEGRTYSLVVALGALLLLSYQRLMFRSRRPDWRLGIALVSGAAGLLYANYFAIVLLAAVGIYHLLTFRNTRRWWYVVYCAAMAAVLVAPSTVGFVRGFSRAQNVSNLGSSFVLSVPELTRLIAHFAGNGGIVFLLILLGVGVFAPWRRKSVIRMMLGITALAFALTLALQLAMNFIDVTKIRYVLVYWSALAVCVGLGMVALSTYVYQFFLLTMRKKQRAFIVLGIVPAVWLAGGLNANLNLLFMTETGEQGFLMRWRTLTNVLKDEGLPEQDIFAYYAGKRQHDDAMSFEYSLWEIPHITSFITGSTFDTSRDWVLGKLDEAQRVWYGMDKRLLTIADHENFLKILDEKGYEFCQQRVNERVVSMDLYVKSSAYCPTNTAIARFGEGISLTGWDAPTTVQAGDRLIVRMGWLLAPDVPPEAYSIGVFVMQGDTVITQGDTRLPTYHFSITDLAIDLTNVAPGDYTLRMAVYNWQTVERLNGSVVQSAETGNLLNIGELRLSD
jgi:hypothetical protein